MIRLMRMIGFLLMAVGVITALSWFIKPLRFVWPWLRQLPLPIQIGIITAAGGFLILLGSVIWERIEDRDQEEGLRDE